MSKTLFSLEFVNILKLNFSRDFRVTFITSSKDSLYIFIRNCHSCSCFDFDGFHCCCSRSSCEHDVHIEFLLWYSACITDCSCPVVLNSCLSLENILVVAYNNVVTIGENKCLLFLFAIVMMITITIWADRNRKRTSMS
jgi:hypothetical protein